MPRGEKREPKFSQEDILASLKLMQCMCAFLPDGPPEPITQEDDAFARENWHIKVTP